MTRVARKRMHTRVRDTYRMTKTKRRTKDLDQIQDDLKPENLARLLATEPDPELPGQGQFLCVECSKHFINDTALVAHRKTKLHKKRVKDLKVPAYTQKEAESAVGLATDNQQKRRADMVLG
ncbi:hypothetical protein M427DRAFT_359174 [Gonapodya prolifera JEL478]|uniref:C2H2-type domain-containing protein n=1 Tax=Gonapodya prolifera (strain JEL478) TaxID=1344416 RepID=A0A139AAK1_GONPJ|nr:hypothetical protein M427DRAFT_359174 [Gonapodya prolifera JEL478]|eukprot:KXS13882.1 hypothetical protein M427DRAFT_359174 [Gonapodya prolifera JEL478]